MGVRSDSPRRSSRAFFTWGEVIGYPECPYLRRWVVSLRALGGVRLHHFTRSDDERDLHDHPWAFVTVVLRGGYVDVSAAGEDRLRAGSVRFRTADHAHAVRLDEGRGCWTLILTGPVVRRWGFLVDGRWTPWREYFVGNDPHQCDS